MSGWLPRLFLGFLLLVAGAAWAGETITYSYDPLGRLVATSSDAGPQSGTTYDAAGNRLNYSVTGTGIDSLTSISIDNASAVEGGSILFTVTRTGNAPGPFLVNYTTAGGTASAGSDYTTMSGVLAFGIGQTSRTVSVPTSDDSAVEGVENFSVTLSNPSEGASLAVATGMGTINDNDTVPPSFAISEAQAVGEGGTLVYTVNKSGSTTGTFTVTYATANGTAVAGADYTSRSDTLTFGPTDASRTIEVATINDSAVETAETVYVNLTGASGNAPITASQASGTINDDDTHPPPAFSIAAAPAVVEGGTLAFAVTKTGPTSQSYTVNFATADGSAVVGSDYASNAGMLTFEIGDVTKVINVSTTDDTAVESMETVVVNLSAPSGGATLSSSQALGQISDNDAAFGFSAPPTVTEGGNLVFTVNRTGSTAASMNVSYASANGTATAGSDYGSVSGTLTFAIGDTSKTISVNTTDDSAIEPSETVLMNLSGATGGASIATEQASGTIDDNDAAFAVADAAPVIEGGALAFLVSRTGSTAAAMNVNYGSANGTATVGSDYTLMSGTLNFAVGEASKTVSVPTLDDSAIEPAETVLLNLSGATGGASIARNQGSGTINDNDASFAIANVSAVAEGGTLAFTVTRTGSTAASMNVGYASADATATAGSDYGSVSGTLTFAIGDTTKTINVLTTDDSAIESSESLTVTISGATGGATITTSQASGTINDNDSAITVANAAPVVEGGTLTFTVARTGTTSAPANVNYATANGSATGGTDYVSQSGTLIFGIGETSKTVSVPTTDETAIEEPETVLLNLSAATGGAVITTPQGSGTIENNDVSFAILPPLAPTVEGGTGAFRVNKTGTVSMNTSVNYATRNLEATAGSDYNAVSGTLTFAAAETMKTIDVVTLDDALAEPVYEWALMDITATTPGVTVTQPTAAMRIDDNDNAAPPTWSVSSPVVTEGGNLVFTVTKTGSYHSSINVLWGTNDGSAVSGSDYTAVYGTLSFAPAETSKTFTVATTDDAAPENAESVLVGIHPMVGAGSFQGSGIISDNDPPPPSSFSISDAAPVAEGGSLAYTISRTGGTAYSFGVRYDTGVGTSPGTGTARVTVDYPSAYGDLMFAPGETSKTILVPTTDDTVDEIDETVVVNLTKPTGGSTIADSQGVGTILDNDTNPAPPSFAVYGTYATTLPEGSPATFYINKNGATASSYSVSYASRNISATAGSDYVAVSGTITFAPGETQKSFTVGTIDDSLAESRENFVIDLSAPTGGATITQGTASHGIDDNDSPALSFWSVTGPPSLSEGGTATFTITRSGPTPQNHTVYWTTMDGTAVAGSDYTAIPANWYTFPAGVTSKTFTVTTLDDSSAESAETFGVIIIPPNAPNRETYVTISDNDVPPAPSFAISNAAAVSEGGTLVYTVTKSGTTNVNHTVAFTTFSGGTATMDNDYPRTAGDLVFLPGETTKTISVPTVDDTVDEANETVLVKLATVTGGATIATAFGSGTINNND